MIDALTLKRAALLVTVAMLAFLLMGSSLCGDQRSFYEEEGKAKSNSLSSPQWSPDGTKLVFGVESMFIVESDGSSLTSLMDWFGDRKKDEYIYTYGATFSPDGTRVAYTLADHSSYTFQVVTSRLDGSDVRALTKKTRKLENFNPAWSPDGTRIALVSERDIVTMDPDGSDVHTVVDCVGGSPCNNYNLPVWSPDGTRIAFRGTYGGQFGGHLFVVGSDGSDLTHLAEGEGGPVGQPAWSPDGSRIAFTQTERRDRVTYTKLYTTNPDASQLHEVVDLGRYPWVENLSWSADGSEIRSGTSPFMVVKPDGSDLRIFSGLRNRYGDFSVLRNQYVRATWSPDGSRIAVYARFNSNVPDKDESIVLFTMAADGSDARILVRYYGDKREAVNGEAWDQNFEWESFETSMTGSTSESTATLTQGESKSRPCTGPGNCEPREVSKFSLSSANLGRGALGEEETANVEEVLEKGLRSVGASPVHIALRGTGIDGSVRCSWRGVARTPSQREEAIRFWLELDDDDPLPAAAEVEQQFMEEIERIRVAFPETAKANFRVLAQGGLSTEFVFLSCNADYEVSEYLLGSGPDQLTIVYDKLAEMRSYDLYSRAHAAVEYGDAALLTEGEYESLLKAIGWGAETGLIEIVEGRESVVFLAPMGAHNAIAIEAWQAVAQWDLQTDEDEVVHAVRLGTSEGDPEHTQTLTDLESRIDTAAEEDEFAGERIESVDDLDDYYEEIGAYDDITPDDGETATFTPDDPPPVLTCANGTAVTDPGVNRGLVHDCEALLAAKDTLAGTETLDWASDTAITGWEGVTTSGTPSRVTELDLSSESLDGTIPAEIGTLFELTVLDLSSNSLTGDIPAELGWLFNLEEIGLSGNQLTGCIPVALEEVATNDLSSLNLLYCRPPSPENLTIGTPEEFRIGLSWDAVSDTANYRVEYRLGRTGSWTTDDDTLTTTTHTVDDLTCGSTYQFRVSAYGSGTTYAAEWSLPSAVLSETPGGCSPEFDASSYAFGIAESAAVGAAVGTVSATDPDGDTVTYAITSGDEDGKFTIGASTGAITAAGALDYETTALYTLTVEAEDGGGNADSVSVAVEVADSVCLDASAVAGAAGNLGLVADCDTLLEIRDALAGTATVDWSEDTAIDSWEGVTVGGSPQRVVGLALPYKGLTGSLPSELGSLGSLSQLDLSNNQLTGAMPSELGSLSDLSQLDLSNNQLRGSIPSELGGLSDLTSLDLSTNLLGGSIPSELGDLSSLTRLYLFQNLLNGSIPSELGNLSNLTRLFLSSNRLTGAIPSELGDLTNLKRLSLAGNQLTGTIPSWLGDLSSLTELYLSSNQLTGSIPPALGNLSSLTELSLGSNQLTGSIPPELGDLTNLKRLSLAGNQLTGTIPSWLGDLTNLYSLSLGNNQLTGAIPSELGDLTNLLSLNLYGNQLTGAIPSWLGDLSNLTHLSLADNQLTGTIPSELGDLTNLKGLFLGNNQLTTGAIPSWLGDLSDLYSLNLSNTQLTGAIPSWLGNLTNLRHLHLSGNQLTGAIPSELGDLSNLKDLHLSGNQLTGAIPSELGGLSDLFSLDLGNNQLTGAIPSELGGLTNLRHLYLGNNQLTGAIPSELGGLSDLFSLDLSNNQLTGAIPPALGNLSSLTELRLSNNQLDWEIPDELNLLANLRFVRLDGNFDLTGPAHLNFTDLTTAFLGYREQETWAVAEFSSATNWSLSGTDSDDFEISSDGVLTFINPPIFESQSSNSYSVQVTASVGSTQKEATVNVDVMHRDIALSVSPDSMGEGDQATEFTVTATLDGDSTRATSTTVTLSLSGTATGSGTDYTAGTLSTITIPADSTSTTTTLTLTPTDDEIVEGDEVVKVVGVLGDLAVSSAWIIIEDDDAATLSLSGPGAEVVEGSDATFTVTLSHAIGPAVTVEWSVTPDTGDFSPSSGSVTFPAGSAANATQSFTITAQDDDLSEGDESFTILLGAMTGDISDEVSVDPSASSVSVTIAESDPIAVTLSGPSSVDEGHSATYTVSLSPDGVTPTADLTVDYATADGTAGSGDYDGVSGTLTFTSSDAGAKTVTVQTTEDSLDEDDETFSFDLSNVSGGGGPTPSLGSPSSITTTIVDDDTEPTGITLSVSPTEVSEGDGSATSVTVTATLDGGSTRATSTTVTLSLSGTATGSGTDYTAGALSTITILAGNATGTASLSITPTDDEIVEGEETIRVEGTASGLTVSPAEITINDGDATPPL